MTTNQHEETQISVLSIMKLSRILLFILILSGFSVPRCSAKVYDSDGSEGSVEGCIRSAAEGDIVTLPAGTFSWTSRLEITKGITLKGQTTIAGAGTSNPTITDATIIQDNTPRKGGNTGTGIIKATMTPAQSFRLTGITFVKGSSTVMPTGGRGAANKLGGQARQQPAGGAGNRPSGAAGAGSLGGGQGITGGNRPSGTLAERTAQAAGPVPEILAEPLDQAVAPARRLGPLMGVHLGAATV